jgi:pimeloyl-ACP methyl ester carboxylesterase
VDLEEFSFRAPDGREIRVRSAPESAGYPVLVHHGTPGSRHLFPPNVEDAARRGLRLIAWDRPGYAGTPGLPGRTIADGAAEADALATALGVSRFATWGFSGGGGYALACAARLPNAVTATVVIASLAPYDDEIADWARGWATEAEVHRYFADPVAARQQFRADAAWYRESGSTPEGWFARWGEAAGADEAHSRPVAEHLALIFRESMRNGDEGWWEDWVAYLSPWGFDVGDIRVPVQLWHGGGDAAAAVGHGRWLAEHIPGVDAHFIEDEDHTNIEALHQVEAWEWMLAAIVK